MLMKQRLKNSFKYITQIGMDTNIFGEMSAEFNKSKRLHFKHPSIVNMLQVLKGNDIKMVSILLY